MPRSHATLVLPQKLRHPPRTTRNPNHPGHPQRRSPPRPAPAQHPRTSPPLPPPSQHRKRRLPPANQRSLGRISPRQRRLRPPNQTTRRSLSRMCPRSTRSRSPPIRPHTRHPHGHRACASPPLVRPTTPRSFPTNRARRRTAAHPNARDPASRNSPGKKLLPATLATHTATRKRHSSSTRGKRKNQCAKLCPKAPNC